MMREPFFLPEETRLSVKKRKELSKDEFPRAKRNELSEDEFPRAKRKVSEEKKNAMGMKFSILCFLSENSGLKKMECIYSPPPPPFSIIFGMLGIYHVRKEQSSHSAGL